MKRLLALPALALVLTACSAGTPNSNQPAAASTTTTTIDSAQLETELEAVRVECSGIRLSAAITNSVGRDSDPAIRSMFSVDDQELQDNLRAAQLRALHSARVAQPTQLELACLEGKK